MGVGGLPSNGIPYGMRERSEVGLDEWLYDNDSEEPYQRSLVSVYNRETDLVTLHSNGV